MRRGAHNLEDSSPRFSLQVFAARRRGNDLRIVFGGAGRTPADHSKVSPIVEALLSCRAPNNSYSSNPPPSYYPALFSGAGTEYMYEIRAVKGWNGRLAGWEEPTGVAHSKGGRPMD